MIIIDVPTFKQQSLLFFLQNYNFFEKNKLSQKFFAKL